MQEATSTTLTTGRLTSIYYTQYMSLYDQPTVFIFYYSVSRSVKKFGGYVHVSINCIPAIRVLALLEYSSC